MLTTGITKRFNHPHEEGSWIELRMLSWRQLQEAREARSTEVLRSFKELGAGFLRDLQGVSADGLQAAQADPLNTYHLGKLLEASIVSWSCEAPISPESIDALDERTALWLLDCIAEYNGLRGQEDPKGLSATSRSTRRLQASKE